MFISRCASSEADMPSIRCHQNVEYECALWDLIRWYSGRDIPELFLLLVILPFSFIFLPD